MQIKNPEAAYKNYKTALSAKGWVLDEDTSKEDAYYYSGFYVKGAKSVIVTIQKDGKVAQIIYSDR